MGYNFKHEQDFCSGLKILTRKDILRGLCTQLAIMGLISKVDRDFPLSPAGVFVFICSQHKEVMNILDIHPLDIIIEMRNPQFI